MNCIFKKNPFSFFNLKTFTLNNFCKCHIFTVKINDYFVTKIIYFFVYLSNIGYYEL